MKIFSGSSNKPLAEIIAKALRIRLSKLEIHVFPDGEKRVRVINSIVDEDCIVVQSASTDADKNYIELFFIVDALKRSGAKSVTAVIPYLGYQRQDHVFRDGEAVSLEVVIKILEGVGVDRVITFDLHSIKIPEFFKIPVVHLSALPLFVEKIKESVKDQGALRSFRQFGDSSNPVVPPSSNLARAKFSKLVSNVPLFKSAPHAKTPRAPVPRFSDTVLVSPDMGGIRRIRILSEMLNGMPYATIDKNRDLKSGKIEASKIHGVVKKKAIVVDDMISTGNTIVAAVDLLSKKGAEEIVVFATHPVFSKDAHILLQKSKVKKVFVTDTISVPKEKLFPKLEVLSVAGIIAQILMHPNRNTPNKSEY